ncbi:MAG: two-component system sensor histidine kinase RegB [Phenylobacterium sp.]|jgi:two-component system sensor histidine kinase RegB
MIIKIFSPDLSNKEQLQQLVVLRQFYLLGEILVVGLAQWWFTINLPWMLIWAVVATHIILTEAYYLFSRIGKKRADIGVHYLLQTILIDLLLFSALLYLSGGATNGAVSILLLPVATAAALFRWRLSLCLAVLAIGCYSLLMFYYRPITGLAGVAGIVDEAHMHHQMSSSSAHFLGMWLTFNFSCLLLVWFIGMQASAVREKNKNLAKLTEEQSRDEQLIAIATFAANAAHDLATPLSSVSLLCDEIKQDALEPQSQSDETIDILISQVNLCRDIVQTISHKALLTNANIREDKSVDDYFAMLIERWLVTRPEINLHFDQQSDQHCDQHRYQQTFQPDPGLESAITNILDNAASAGVANGINDLNLTMEVTLDNRLELRIRDFGIGIDERLKSQLGKAPVNSKADGLGLGQFLANSTIARNGGNVWRNSSDSGTETLITLPLIK